MSAAITPAIGIKVPRDLLLRADAVIEQRRHCRPGPGSSAPGIT
jgi:hypothetical protein